MEQRLGDIAWNSERDPERLAIFPGNYDRNSVKRGLKTVELRATTASVGRNSVRINFDGEKLTQITGIQCDDRNSARMEAFEEDYKMMSSSIESQQYRSTDVKVWDNTTTRTLSFGKETADQAIQQGSARVNNRMQQDIGELATQTSPPS
ncbi:hypothetical protein R3P38DRAFT_2792260 [Favolaschia claudopus]|uniref:Uncharacterized protein n=1 Tax=Favolaschia claudopus TaxID=2862362 RepID=A0AAW0AEP7_9AGAR